MKVDELSIWLRNEARQKPLTPGLLEESCLFYDGIIFAPLKMSDFLDGYGTQLKRLGREHCDPSPQEIKEVLETGKYVGCVVFNEDCVLYRLVEVQQPKYKKPSFLQRILYDIILYGEKGEAEHRCNRKIYYAEPMTINDVLKMAERKAEELHNRAKLESENAQVIKEWIENNKNSIYRDEDKKK